jgi:predicted membrane-bound spermidine synthase
LLGNTVWSSALVTASFMAGLAAGNAAVARRGWRLRRPLRAYALLEATVAATGLLLVIALPRLVPLLTPLLSAAADRGLLDALRFTSAFVLLAVPSTAMGATLPVLARALGGAEADFGRVLGRLYGWNTLGAVAGAVAGEAVLIGAFGVTGTAGMAAALNLGAAWSALQLDRRWPPLAPLPPRPAPAAANARLMAAAFLSGALLLALEIVWFRFMLLLVTGTTVAFAVMLAVVLAGIGLGGLLASRLARHPAAGRAAPLLAVAAGVTVVAGYATLRFVAERLPDPAPQWPATGLLSVHLMLPVCVASGMLFVALGRALHAGVGEEAAAAGRLTLANTVGAMTGALAAAFGLLPLLGIERSLFLLAAGYAAVALLTWTDARPSRRETMAAAATLLAALAAFPFGGMERWYAETVRARYGRDTAVLAAMEESLTETVFLLRYDFLGQPRIWRVVTNRVSMSGTNLPSRRYMGQYVWWPVAVHPGPRRALLISYGLGTTARALVATRELERIDVVDVSSAVLETSARVWPDPSANPLGDPRVRVHVEDGRFYLQTARETYDLITGEPPPPPMVGHLYTREYFELMKARLAPGGFVTYWLPVLQMPPRDTFAVVRGFCDVFDDCSLWTGYGHDWMLAGSRGAAGGVTEERFARQWSDPRVLPLLQEAGFDTPAHLGATFLADSTLLKAATARVAPLVDDHPHRLMPRSGHYPAPEYHAMMDTGAARARFATSALIRRLWPGRWARETLPHFDGVSVLNRVAWFAEEVAASPPMELVLRGADSPAVVLVAFDSDWRHQQIAAEAVARGGAPPEAYEVLAIGALSRRDYAGAEALFARAESGAGGRAPDIARWRALARHMAAGPARSAR